ncbi:MAG: DsbE family thiol:disulfide interchange protein [Sphingomonadales bacterium]
MTALRSFLPVAIFMALAAAFFIGLDRDPSAVPAAMVGKPAPEFDLPPLDGSTAGFSTADLKGGGLSVVNVFASWCAPCRQEHPQLMALAEREGVRVYAINYKDDPQNARSFLDNLGNPFDIVGVDSSGRAAIDWGVYGVPETFIVDGDGIILFKHVGAILDHDLEDRIIPLLERHGS